jgi:hypothetical protein
MLRNKEVQALFEDYYYDGLESEHKKTFSYTTTSHSVNSCSSSTISWMEGFKYIWISLQYLALKFYIFFIYYYLF